MPNGYTLADDFRTRAKSFQPDAIRVGEIWVTRQSQRPTLAENATRMGHPPIKVSQEVRDLGSLAPRQPV
jgi:hypothetical protein